MFPKLIFRGANKRLLSYHNLALVVICLVQLNNFGYVEGKKSYRKDLKKSEKVKKPEICDTIECSTPHQDFVCTTTTVPQPKVTMKLGAFKDCCTMRQCRDNSESHFIYIGIFNKNGGEEMKAEPGKAFNAISLGSTMKKNQTSCPLYIPFSMVCMIEYQKTLVFQKLLQGEEDVCPTAFCTERTNTEKITRTFRVLQGQIPITPVDIKKEKGTPVGQKRCPNVKCAEKPIILKNQTCKSVTIEDRLDRAEVEALGEFAECCPKLWHCEPNLGYGLEYMTYEMTGESFRYFSVLLFDVVKTKDSRNNPKQCANVSCPTMIGEGSHACTFDITGADRAFTDFGGDILDCCPIYKCHDNAGKPKHGLLLLEGSAPTESKENCKAVSCGGTPKIKGAHCTSQTTQELESKYIAKSMGNQRSCCPVWKCTHNNGRIYYQYEMSGQSFRYKEIQSASEKIKDLVIVVAGNKRLSLLIPGQEIMEELEYEDEESATNSSSGGGGGKAEYEYIYYDEDGTAVTRKGMKKGNGNNSSQLEGDVVYYENGEDDHEGGKKNKKWGKSGMKNVEIIERGEPEEYEVKQNGRMMVRRFRKVKRKKTGERGMQQRMEPNEEIHEEEEEDEPGYGNKKRIIVREKKKKPQEKPTLKPSKAPTTPRTTSMGRKAEGSAEVVEEEEINEDGKRKIIRKIKKKGHGHGEGATKKTEPGHETTESFEEIEEEDRDGEKDKDGKKKKKTKVVVTKIYKKKGKSEQETTEKPKGRTFTSATEPSKDQGLSQEESVEYIEEEEEDADKSKNGGKKRKIIRKLKKKDKQGNAKNGTLSASGKGKGNDESAEVIYEEEEETGSEQRGKKKKIVRKITKRPERTGQMDSQNKDSAPAPTGKGRGMDNSGSGETEEEVEYIDENGKKKKVTKAFKKKSSRDKKSRGKEDQTTQKTPSSSNKPQGRAVEIEDMNKEFKGSQEEQIDHATSTETPLVSLEVGTGICNSTCPKLKLPGCKREIKRATIRKFFPEDEDCCPIFHCILESEETKMHKTHYMKLSGQIPTDLEAIKREKHSRKNVQGSSRSCPSIQCRNHSTGRDSGISCETDPKGQYFYAQAKPFEECCPAVKCKMEDGSYYIETKIIATTFAYYERSFYNIKSWPVEEDHEDSFEEENKSGKGTDKQDLPSTTSAPNKFSGRSLDEGVEEDEGDTDENDKKKKVVKKKKQGESSSAEISNYERTFKIGANQCESSDHCPQLKNVKGHCHAEKMDRNSIVKYFPENESCCHLTHCQEKVREGGKSVRRHRTYYVKYVGKIPKAGEKVQKEKGKDSAGVCTKIKCKARPTQEDCSYATTEEGKAIFANANAFLDCCKPVKCHKESGMFTIEIHIIAISFAYYELSHYNVSIDPKGSQQNAHDHDDDSDEDDDVPKATAITESSQPSALGRGVENNMPESTMKAPDSTTTSPEIFTTKMPESTSKNTREAEDPDDNMSSLTDMIESDIKKSSEYPSQHRDVTPTSELHQFELHAGTCANKNICPEMDLGKVCHRTGYEGALDEFFPRNETCCHLTHCQDEEDKGGLHRSHYVKLAGVIPNQPSDIQKEKGKAGEQTSRGKGQCPKIQCGDFSIKGEAFCSLEFGRDQISSDQMKPFLECCPTLECKRPDGSYSIEMKIISTSFAYYELSFYHIRKWVTSEKKEEENSDDQLSNSLMSIEVGTGVCDLTTCPKLKLSGCKREIKRATIRKFFPENEDCCPILHCISDSDEKIHKTLYMKLMGAIPTESEAIKKEKYSGKRVQGSSSLCPSIQCGNHSLREDNSITCDTDPDGQFSYPQAKPFEECCPTLKCKMEDGSYYIETKIIATTFAYYERSFYNIKSWPTEDDEDEPDHHEEKEDTDKFTGGPGEEYTPIRVGDGQCDPADICPVLDLGSGCQPENPRVTTVKYYPKNESCCPVMHCYDGQRGVHETHYAKFSRWIPTNSSQIQKEKGKDDGKTGTGTCTKIQCGNDSISSSKTDTCKVLEPLEDQVIYPDIEPFLECCPRVKCELDDGSYSLEMKITGVSFSYYEISFYNIPHWSTAEDKKNASEKDGSNKSPQNETVDFSSRHSSCKPNDICPELDMGATCHSVPPEMANSYVPRKERCCDLHHCFDFDGSHTTHYVKYSGWIPTNDKEIESERGTSTDRYCPNIKCQNESAFSRLNESCRGIPSESIYSLIKPFEECCEMMECQRKDGSYSLELRMTAPSFTYYEVSFYNVKSWNEGTFGRTKTSKSGSSSYYSESFSETSETKWGYQPGNSSSSPGKGSQSKVRKNNGDEWNGHDWNNNRKNEGGSMNGPGPGWNHGSSGWNSNPGWENGGWNPNYGQNPGPGFGHWPGWGESQHFGQPQGQGPWQNPWQMHGFGNNLSPGPGQGQSGSWSSNNEKSRSGKNKAPAKSSSTDDLLGEKKSKATSPNSQNQLGLTDNRNSQSQTPTGEIAHSPFYNNQNSLVNQRSGDYSNNGEFPYTQMFQSQTNNIPWGQPQQQMQSQDSSNVEGYPGPWSTQGFADAHQGMTMTNYMSMNPQTNQMMMAMSGPSPMKAKTLKKDSQGQGKTLKSKKGKSN